jgi:hypothetical protein
LGWPVAFHTDGDALADAADGLDRAAINGRKRRVDGAEKEDAGQADSFEGLLKDARLKSGNVRGDVGEFGHWLQACNEGGRLRNGVDALTDRVMYK